MDTSDRQTPPLSNHLVEVTHNIVYLPTDTGMWSEGCLLMGGLTVQVVKITQPHPQAKSFIASSLVAWNCPGHVFPISSMGDVTFNNVPGMTEDGWMRLKIHKFLKLVLISSQLASRLLTDQCLVISS